MELTHALAQTAQTVLESLSNGLGLHRPTELNSTIHRQFRDAHAGHKPHAGLDPSRASTGVVWTSERAGEHGYWDHPEEWANLGQGAPEVSDGMRTASQVVRQPL